MEGEKGRGDGPEDCLTFQGWEWKCTIRVGGEGRDGAACCRGGWRRPSLHGEGFKGLRRALEDWHTRGDPGPELPGSNRLCWFFIYF